MKLKGVIIAVCTLLVVGSCSQEQEHTAPAIYARDSASVMTTYGVNTLISDSGVMKYRIITERWEVNDAKKPSRWIFNKGLFLEQFDETFHVQSHIQCDTAYYYDKLKKWELRGRVFIQTKDGLQYVGSELFWDQKKRMLYSNKYSKLTTPERKLEGSRFESDEQMTKYKVWNTKGEFEKGDIDSTPRDTMTQAKADSMLQSGRQRMNATPKHTTIPLPTR